MLFFHLSDLHIGKQLHGYDLLEDQKEILHEIIEKAREYKPDALLLCGDIYDRSLPAADAVTVFDHFLCELAQLPFALPVLLIAGNHDSPERLQYASEFLKQHNIFISALPPQSEGETISKVTLEDGNGKVNFYLLPFLKPSLVRHYMPEEASAGEERIVDALIKRSKVNWEERNVLLSHQFYVNQGKSPETCESEQLRVNVGGLDCVDCSVVKEFDYVALGHIHSPQSVGKETIRYCGTPLQYSVSEAGQEKALVMVELGEKGKEPIITSLPLCPSHKVFKIKGDLEELKSQAFGEQKEGYVSLVLTQDQIPENSKDLLDAYYDHILEVQIDNDRMRHVLEDSQVEFTKLEPYDAFDAFFEEVTGRKMDQEEADCFREILQSVADSGKGEKE